jgi:hypothetical protein
MQGSGGGPVNATDFIAGFGGSSYMGGGAKSPATTSGLTVNGYAYGGGGAGGNAFGTLAGGTGASGVVVVEY